MISILMKRRAHQSKQAGKEENKVIKTKSERTALADKPWEEIQGILKNDLNYLRTLPGHKEKGPYKEQLIKKYQPVVDKLLATHKGDYGNLDVMWHFYLWHVDLGKLENVYEDFRQAVSAGLDTPVTWKMDGQTAFLGYVFNYSHNAYKASQTFNVKYLTNAVTDLLNGELATNSALKVKIFRLAGDLLYDANEQEDALTLYELVMNLSPDKGGCKGKIKELKQELGHDT